MPDDTAIGQSPFDTYIPSDTPAAFHMKPFSSLLRPFPGRPSIVPRGLRSSVRRGDLKASLTKSLTLLHRRSRIRPLRHIPQGTLLRLEFSTPPIGQNTLPFSRNQGLEVDDDMEPAPKTFPSVDTPAADTLFEGQIWGWDGINFRAVVAQNQNGPSLQNGWIPQSLSYIDIFLHCLPLKWLRIFLLP